MTRIAVAVLMLAAAMEAAVANQAEGIAWVGFSPNGRFFAFATVGEPEASDDYIRETTTKVIDVASGRHLKGSPAVVVEKEKKGRKEREAAARVRVLLKKANISKQGVMTAVVRYARPRDVVVSWAEMETLQAVNVTYWDLPRAWFGREAKLVLSQEEMASEKCDDDSRPTAGFTLLLERESKQPVTLHQDQSLPARDKGEFWCPFKYGIAEINARRLMDGSIALAVMVQVFTQGWEGPDRRFRAVTARIPR